MSSIFFILFYLTAVTAIVLHFTGHLERWGMEWLMLVLAVCVFPVVLYL